MTIEYKAPGPDEILAVQYRARQMQAETLAAGVRAVGRALRAAAQRIAAFGARSAGA